MANQCECGKGIMVLTDIKTVYKEQQGYLDGIPQYSYKQLVFEKHFTCITCESTYTEDMETFSGP